MNPLKIIIRQINTIVYLIVFSICFTLIGCSGPRPLKIVILGLDAANWNSLDPLMEADRLPNLSRLRHSGAFGPLQTFIPTASPAIWTTIATGQSPDKHGIKFRVLQLAERGREQELMAAISSDERKVKALWNMFSDFGLKSAFIRWWATWPAEKMYGVMISDKLHEPRLKRTTFPLDLRKTLSEEGLLKPRLPPDEEQWVKDLQNRFRTWRKQVEEGRTKWTGSAPDMTLYFQDLEEKLQAYRRIMAQDYQTELITHYLLDTDPELNVLAPYFWYMDICQHVFWKYWRPEGYDLDSRELELFGELVPHYYEFIDGVVGRILKHAGSQAMVVVVSDHGMESYYSERYVNELFDVDRLLEDLGLFKRRNDGTPDFGHSVAYQTAESRQIRLINIPLQGRERNARIPQHEHGSRVLEIAGILESIHTTGSETPLFSDVRVLQDSVRSYNTNGFIHYVFEDADMVISLNDHIDLDDSLTIRGKTYPLTRWNRWRPAISGQHHKAPEGIFILSGGPFHEDLRVSGARVHDITPTIMAALGLPVANDLDGRVLDTAFKKDFFTANPLRRISSYGDRPEFKKERIGEDDLGEDLINQLKAIGYLR